MQSSSYRLDRQRAVRILSVLSHAMASRLGLLDEQDDLVENQVPPGVGAGSSEHAAFLFYIVPNDRGVRSAHLWQRAKDLHASHRHLFDPRTVVAQFAGDVESLRTLLQRTLRPRYAGHAARAWVANSGALLERFGGDPCRLLSASSDAAALLKAICSFSGFGPKTGGMLLRAAVGLRFATVCNLEAAEMPVDIHDTRISFFTQMVGFDDPDATFDPAGYMTFAGPVRRFLSDVCAAERIEWPDVDRALWLIGSRGCAPKRCHLCPIRSFCSFYALESERSPHLFDEA